MAKIIRGDREADCENAGDHEVDKPLSKEEMASYAANYKRTRALDERITEARREEAARRTEAREEPPVTYKQRLEIAKKTQETMKLLMPHIRLPK